MEKASQYPQFVQRGSACSEPDQHGSQQPSDGTVSSHVAWAQKGGSWQAVLGVNKVS